MIYPTVKATVRQGKIKFLDDVTLPENSTLLITILDYDAFDTFTLGEHLAAGLEDVLSGQVIETATTSELAYHLDVIFSNRSDPKGLSAKNG